jgi:hypothetical protein
MDGFEKKYGKAEDVYKNPGIYDEASFSDGLEFIFLSWGFIWGV